MVVPTLRISCHYKTLNINFEAGWVTYFEQIDLQAALKDKFDCSVIFSKISVLIHLGRR